MCTYAGGVAVYSGVNFVEWSSVLLMCGTGPFTVVGGVCVCVCVVW